jgi:putative transposase
MINRLLKKKDEQMQLVRCIYDIRQDHPTMGVRDIYHKMLPDCMGRDAFERFCKEQNLMSKSPKNYRRTTDSSGVIRFDNLIENVIPTRINQIWQSDISYFEVRGKFYYLTFILDAYSRRIIGHATSERLFTEQTTLPALDMAIRNRKINNPLSGINFSFRWRRPILR